MASIARIGGLPEEEVDGYLSAAEKMQDSVEEHGWDGAWFLRAYDDSGNRVGSRACEEGQIYIEPQGICILASIGLNDGRG